VSHIIFR